jgi:raffinose/stachyose/melibiose transport system permease protein
MFRYTKLTALREFATWVVALVGLLPFYFLVIMALKPDDEIITTGSAESPRNPTLSNFTEVLTTGGNNNILQSLVNSFLVTASSIVGLVLLGSLAAYVLARRTAAWSRWTFYGFLFAIIMPTQLGIIPLYIGVRTAGLIGSVWGLAIIYVATLMPLAVFLYAGFFRELPREYEEAAALDGAGPTAVFFQVVLPLMAPVTGTVAILTGLIVWNDFFNSLIFLGGSSGQTLPVSMYYYVGSLISAWNKIFAIVIISMVPILAFYLFAQKRFIQGFAGGLKT